MYGIFVGQNGKVVGNDGIDDSRVYALKTTESKFANDVAGAGLSREALDATVKFIKKNSGNASEFRSNSIAYDNSIEIEGSATVRRAMIDIIEQDNSRGGTSDQNNREYGGSVNGGIVEAAPPGPVSNPKKNGLATITLSTQQNTSAKFHSHPSGTRNEITRSGIGTTINTFFFTQSPSPDDIC